MPNNLAKQDAICGNVASSTKTADKPIQNTVSIICTCDFFSFRDIYTQVSTDATTNITLKLIDILKLSLSKLHETPFSHIIFYHSCIKIAIQNHQIFFTRFKTISIFIHASRNPMAAVTQNIGVNKNKYLALASNKTSKVVIPIRQSIITELFFMLSLALCHNAADKTIPKINIHTCCSNSIKRSKFLPSA